MPYFTPDWINVLADGCSSMVPYAALGLAVYTAYLQRRSNSESRLIACSQILIELTTRWNSPEIKGNRKSIAAALKSRVDTVFDLELEHSIPALELLEDIGYLTRIGALDQEMVWNSFHWIVRLYVGALRLEPNCFAEVRKRTGRQAIFCELVWMVDRLGVIDAKKQGVGSKSPPSREEINAFFGQ